MMVNMYLINSVDKLNFHVFFVDQDLMGLHSGLLHRIENTTKITVALKQALKIGSQGLHVSTALFIATE